MAVTPLRTKTLTGAVLNTNPTVTFDEGTALDSTHLLVAIVSATSNAAPTASGWTAAASGGGTARRVVVFVRQGNGSVNSITVSAGGGSGLITLLAFPGFVSTTPLATGTGAPTNSTFAIALSTTPAAGYGVVLAGLVGSSTGAIGAWSNGYTEILESTSNPRATQAYRDSDGTTAASTVTVTSSTSGGWAVAAFSLVDPAAGDVSYALGSVAVTLALGSDPMTGVVG
jgi:hypothetical protein